MRNNHPLARIIFLVDTFSEVCRRQAIALNAQGILHRSISREFLVKSLELIAIGGSVFSPTAIEASPGARAAAEETCEGASCRTGDNWAQAHSSAPLRAWHAIEEPANRHLAASSLAEPERPTLSDVEIISRRCENLSAREMEILDYVAKGFSNKAIARICHISDATVKVHVKSILRKINVTNRTQAAIWEMNRTQGAIGFIEREIMRGAPPPVRPAA
ncbi:hypothetical protein GTW10_07560 [Aurantimonas endophytica]|nr:response regulator transcription factor [Aurantimonas endophytica]MCO6403348.1 hypothetical protein [Aurantimonas endophytica]